MVSTAGPVCTCPCTSVVLVFPKFAVHPAIIRRYKVPILSGQPTLSLDNIL